MARKTYSREDVETHYGSDRPAVNVKVYASLEDGYSAFKREEPNADEGFTLDWIRDNLSNVALDSTFWNTCEAEYEYLEAWATSDEDCLFPDHRVELERDGRSGGWVVVTGLPAIEEWDAVLLGRWRKFERVARSIADAIMENVVNTIYINDWEWNLSEAAEAERAANQDVATRSFLEDLVSAEVDS